MTQDISAFVPADTAVLALGEPTHQEPAFGRIRNELLPTLAGLGFRCVVLETDRVAALAVDDFVRGGAGTLDEVLATGFSHGFGDLPQNRELVVWLREFNAGRAEAGQIAFHGYDASTENMNAPSPRTYLEHGRDFLGLDTGIAELAGDDERWHRTEAVLDPAQSPGATPEAAQLRVIADDMLNLLYTRTPGDDPVAWHRARINLTAGLGLLRYHAQAAVPMERGARVSALMVVRDALMAQNLIDIHEIERHRGPVVVFSHNLHLQRTPSHWELPGLDLRWTSAGAVAGALTGGYVVIAGSVGRSDALGLGDPAPGTYEAALPRGEWSLTPAAEITPATERTDTEPRMGYFPLTPATLAGVDAVLHISGHATD